MMRSCSKCDIKKLENEFHNSKRICKDGSKYLNPQCKVCANLYATEYRKKNAQKIKINTQSNNYKFSKYKTDAKRRNYEFNLTFDRFKELRESKKCYYCGDEYEFLGVDRFDNTKGYLYTNSVPCCFTCNNMKSNRKYDDFVKHCGKVHNNLQDKKI